MGPERRATPCGWHQPDASCANRHSSCRSACRARNETHTTTRSGRPERGATTLEAILTLPILLLVLFSLLHVGIRTMATHAATVAAEQGLHAARIHDGTAASAEQRINDALVGAPFVTSHTAAVSRGAAIATVTVNAEVTTVLPGVSSTISVTRTGPVEAQR